VKKLTENGVDSYRRNSAFYDTVLHSFAQTSNCRLDAGLDLFVPTCVAGNL
jgi:hypothetical protein